MEIIAEAGLTKEELGEKERKELEEARKEITKGSKITLEDLIKELSSGKA
jgi:hypothetical protein